LYRKQCIGHHHPPSINDVDDNDDVDANEYDDDNNEDEHEMEHESSNDNGNVSGKLTFRHRCLAMIVILHETCIDVMRKCRFGWNFVIALFLFAILYVGGATKRFIT